MSYAAVAKVLLLDDDTIRTWRLLYEQDGIEGLANFGIEYQSRPGTDRAVAPTGHGA